ncbi:MAG: di-heme oxidoredictase family protein, partial [Bacteroidia bacterium]|nr:c-type cytochrome [Bacteroidia bacterium]MDW8334615.1 di-heme oxidoredictase family protein [Bacteroidia bacterium]
DPVVQKGENLFLKAGCGKCHTPKLSTAPNAELRQAAGQTIFPYTDMLLHDMGEGLADNRPEFRANGREWRTPPLWGVGKTELVNGHTYFLHDGRARNFKEAILWHGGEAQKSVEFFRNLSREEREAIIAFLQSL